MHRLRLVLSLLALTVLGPVDALAADWIIPAGGNAFRTTPGAGRDGIRRDGTVSWSNPTEVYSLFFHVDRPATLDLSIDGRIPGGPTGLQARVAGSDLVAGPANPPGDLHPLGRTEVREAGYVRVDLRPTGQPGDAPVEIRSLRVASDTADLAVDFVRNNDGNMFYWGRRGPSVHLRYEVPKERSLRYAYSEVTVPEGEDTIGSFYMANGFGEGYFGMQVNSPTERRVLFSVWSPFQTDNPRDIPEAQRIVARGRGPGVRIGEFGNEGSGGQSYLVHPWVAGRTYRFLTEVRPDGMGNTTYTAWFGDKAAGEWRLIASFQRPQTDTHLRGFHSFLESFNPALGHIGRRADYGNVWVRDVDGVWHEATRARFSVDPTGGGRHRLDYAGGADGSRFFLRNCGFFSGAVPAGTTFVRESTAGERPDVDPDALPRE